MAEWTERTKESAEATSFDRLIGCEDDDQRVHFHRRAVVGGVVDGRAARPGVLLTALTCDGAWQELGVSARGHAVAVLDCLLAAWPDLLEVRS